MLNTELDSFILKFKQLCQAGLDAHLAVDSQAGKVWVHLHVPLGQALGPSQEEQPTQIRKNRNGPSRQRRRARRKAARLEATTENDTEQVQTEVIIAEKAFDYIPNQSDQVNDAAEAIKSRSNNDFVEENAVKAVNENNVENELDDFGCGFCGLDCLNETCLEHHLYQMHAEDINFNEVEESEDSFDEESEDSSDEEPEETEESKAEKQAESKEPNDEYHCKECIQNFKNSGQLRRHKKNNHKKEITVQRTHGEPE